MNETLRLARKAAATAIHQARSTGPRSAFDTMREAHRINAACYDIAYTDRSQRALAVHTLAGLLITDRTYRAMRGAW